MALLPETGGGRRHPVVTYGYDDLYRLTSENIAFDSHGNNGQVSYTFDNVGNRLQRSSALPAIPATGLLNYDANDRTSTDPYDSNGNLLNGGVGSNVYDFENHMVAAGGVSLVYDGDGNRVKETVAGVATSYLVADQNLTGYDGHGSVRFLTSSTGAITDTYDYDAFGSLISSTGSTPNNYLFAGEQFDPLLGIYYNRARYYDQRQGRFWTMDTWEGNAREAISLHKYLYTGANPVNMTDPRGNDFDLGSLQAAGAAFTTLATTALISVQNVLGSVYLNLYKIPEIIETASNYLTVGLGAFEALRMLGTNVLNYAESYSRGPATRGFQFEEAAGANLGRTFPAIDYYDPNRGVAIQIRSTTQTQSPDALLAVIRKGVNPEQSSAYASRKGSDRKSDRHRSSRHTRKRPARWNPSKVAPLVWCFLATR